MGTFGEWLSERMKDKGWGIREAARNIGVSHPTISSIVTYGEQPSFETCKALSKAFDIPIEDIMRMAGLLPKSITFNPRTSEMVDLFNGLPDEEQDEMLQVARIKKEKVRGGKQCKA